MAVRDFTARDGRRWRAWDVSPESIKPLTKAEDYLADCYRDGWVVFETVDGTEKRRLCPPPYAWDKRSDEDLEELLRRADTLRPRGQLRVTRDRIVPADLPPNVPDDVAAAMPRDLEGDLDLRYLGVVRSFPYPGGGIWIATVVDVDPDRPLVLRFSSGTQTIDLTDWPPGWVDFTNEQLIELLREGQATHERRRPDPPTRRHDDPGAEPNAR